jgi:hypothetical protein
MLTLLCLVGASADDSCAFEDWHSIVNGLATVGTPSRKLLSVAGLKVNSTIPTLPGGEFLPYVYSSASFAVPFLFIFAIFFIELPCHLIFCWCPFCRPKAGKEQPGFIKTFLHLLGCALLVATAGMFFYSAAQFTIALDRFVDLPDGIQHTLVVDVLGHVVSVLNSTIEIGVSQIDRLRAELDDLTNWLSTEGNRTVALAQELDDSDLPAYQSQFAGEFATNLTALVLQSMTNQQVAGGLVAMNTSLPLVVTSARGLAAQLVEAGPEITDNAQGASEQFDKVIDPALESIESVQRDTVGPMVDDATDTLADFVSMVNGYLDRVAPLRSLVNGVVYSICGVFAGAAFVYAVVFFYNGCLARCIVVCFPLIAWVFALAIVLPGAAFAVIFFLLYDFCPGFETLMGGMSPMPLKNGSTLADLLLCSDHLPILDLMDVGFDPSSILDNIASTMGGKVQNMGWDNSHLTEKLSGFAANFSVNETLASSTVHYSYDTLLPGIADPKAEAMKAFIEAKDTELLTPIRAKFVDVIGFGTRVVGQVNNTVADVKFLIDDTIQKVTVNINNGVNGLTCEPLKCIWAPLKNVLCGNFISGIAFWITSTMCLAVGILWLEASLSARRRSMGKPKVSGEEEGAENDEEKEKELKEIQNAEKFRAKRRNKRRSKRTSL